MKRQTLYSRYFKKLVWIGFSGVLLLPESLFSSPLHHQAERWVATSPQVTELLYQLGWGENLVGAPAGSQHPEEAKKLSSIGNFLSPNLEKILRLKPTKVWADTSDFGAYDRLQKEGIETILLDLRTVVNVFHSAEKIGSRTSLLQEAKRNWQKKIKAKSFTFLVLAWPDPPMLFGEDTFLFDLISKKGGKGLLPKHWKRGFFYVSPEWLMAQNPDRVFFLNHGFWSAQQYEKACQFWWPEPQEEQKCFPLSANHFARASLTPFLHLKELSLP